MILDFNSRECNFTLYDLTEYNVDTIFDNIDKFKRFVSETVLSEDFNKVFNTRLFQFTLNNPDTANMESLLVVYNSMVTTLMKKPLPQLTDKQLRRELRGRGYTITRVSKKLPSGIIEKTYKVHLPSRYE